MELIPLWRKIANESIDTNITFLLEHHEQISDFLKMIGSNLTEFVKQSYSDPEMIKNINYMHIMVNRLVKLGQYDFLERNVPYYRIWLHPLQLSYIDNISHQEQFDQTLRYLTFSAPPTKIRLSDGILYHKKKYHIGILVTSLTQGSIMCLLDAFILFFNQHTNKWKLTVYYTGNNPWTISQIQFKNVNHIVNNPYKLAQFVYQDDIDILLNIDGNLAAIGRCVVLKPAKIIITWLGTLLTSGFEESDYKITDSLADPENTQELFTEKLIHIPRAFCVMPRVQLHPPDRWKDLPYYQNNYITFGCFNVQRKISNSTLFTWVNILNKVPNSRLMLKNPTLCNSSIIQQQIIDFFTQQGIDPSRIIIGPYYDDQIQYRQQFHDIDIFLDTFPHGAASMAFDKVYMCRLVITLKGNTHAGRICASVYERMGVTDNIAHNIEEYVEKAVYFATNPSRLDELSRYLETRNDVFEFEEQQDELYEVFERVLIEKGLDDPFKIYNNSITTLWNNVKTSDDNDKLIQFMHKYYNHPDVVRIDNMWNGVGYNMVDFFRKHKEDGLVTELGEEINCLYDMLGQFCVVGQFEFVKEHFSNCKLWFHPLQLSYLPNISHEEQFNQTKRIGVEEKLDNIHFSDGIVHQKNKYTIGLLIDILNRGCTRCLLDAFITRFPKYISKWNLIIYHTDEPWDIPQIRFKNIEALKRHPKELARVIHQDNVDILLNIEGNQTPFCNSIIFKPAPIIITWLGTLLTSGYNESDYKITDSYVDPEDTQEIFTEKLIRIPRAFCMMPEEILHPQQRWKELPYYKNRYITFGVFNVPKKITKNAMIAWSQILSRVSNSKLWFKHPIICKSSILQKQIIEFFTQYHIDPSRIIIGPYYDDQVKFREQFHDADILLDTFPHTAASMAFDTVYMCRITVTLKGNTHAGRICASIYERMGVTDNIAHNIEEYIDKAVYLASNPSQLNELSRYLETRNDVFEFEEQQDELYDIFEKVLIEKGLTIPFNSIVTLWNQVEQTKDTDKIIEFMYNYYNHPDVIRIDKLWYDAGDNISEFFQKENDIAYEINCMYEMIGQFCSLGQLDFVKEHFLDYKLWFHPLQLSYLPNISHEEQFKQARKFISSAQIDNYHLSNGMVKQKDKYTIGILIEVLNSSYIRCLLDAFLILFPKYSSKWNLIIYNTDDAWNLPYICFRNIKHVMDQPLELAKIIHQDNVDILLNIEGNQTSVGLSILFKPAPIIITWLGTLLTSAFEESDYKITDSYVDPENTQEIFTEKLIRIPRAFCAMPETDLHPQERWKDLPYYQNRYITFGVYNIRKKITNEAMKIWSTILLKVPTSKLLIKHPIICKSSILQQQMIDFFTQQGIDPSRISIGSYYDSHVKYREQFHDVDLLLDTFPHTAASMAFDMVYMCRLAITLKGNTHAGRICASVYERMGVTSNIANSVEDYIEKAVYLAKNPNKLNKLSRYLETRNDVFEFEQQQDDFYNVFDVLIQRHLIY